MAGIDRLRLLARQLRDELAGMRAQVALTPTLLGDRECRPRTEDGTDDSPASSVAALRKLVV